jgi:phosphoenolpyruvate carboxylase
LSASEPIIPNTLEFSAEMSQTVHLFRLIRRVLSDINPEAIDTYLISPAGRPSDVLTMQWLAKDAGVPDTALDIHATRIEALMYLRIGSRPAKRQQSQRIEDLRRSRGYLHGCKVGMRCRAGTA